MTNLNSSGDFADLMQKELEDDLNSIASLTPIEQEIIKKQTQNLKEADESSRFTPEDVKKGLERLGAALNEEGNKELNPETVAATTQEQKIEQPPKPPEDKPKEAPKQKTLVQATSKVAFLSMTDLDTAYRLANAFARSGSLPKTYTDKLSTDNPKDLEKMTARALMAMQLGAEIGLPPMQSITSIAFVNDSPNVWGDAQLAICRSSGLLKNFRETYDESMQAAICFAERVDTGETSSNSFSLEDARNAGLLGKDNYKRYLKRMLKMRARAWTLRDLFTDVLKGLTHTYEEMIDVTPFEDRPVSRGQELAASLSEELLIRPQAQIENKPAAAFNLQKTEDKTVISNGVTHTISDIKIGATPIEEFDQSRSEPFAPEF